MEMDNNNILISASSFEQPVSNKMTLHQIFMFLMGTLLVFLQLMYQSKNVSPFDTHYTTILAFFVALSVYVVALAADMEPCNSNYAEVVNKIKLLSAILALVLLLLILIPAFGWITLAMWVAYSMKVVLQFLFVRIHRLYLLLIVDILKKGINGHLIEQQDRPPV